MKSIVAGTKNNDLALRAKCYVSDSTEMILHLILRYLGTDPCRRWLRPARDWNPNDCHRLTELITFMLVHLQTVHWTFLDEGDQTPTHDYGWENVAL